MDRPNHENVDFFIGYEVEKSPMHGAKTLFVKGIHSKETILSYAFNNGCHHIYMGADRSFDPVTIEDFEVWHDLLVSMLKDEVWVSLDFDVSYVNDVLQMSAVEYRTFIPMVSVQIPYADQLGYNAVVKIDDADFKKSNPGVWCHQLRDLMNRDNFTSWDKYASDEPISKVDKD